MMRLLRKIIPAWTLAAYHKALAIMADFYYGRPSGQLIVIGVTGTNGKTTTVSLISRILEEAGHKVGAASTAIFKIGNEEWLNDKKMTMLGRFALQKMLAKMVRAGCKFAVIETSSQGIEQFRHIGIRYDACVFTNLTPEHLEAHGGFENYKAAKLKLFSHLENLPEKIIEGKKIAKSIIVNGDDPQAAAFLDFNIEKKIVYGLGDGCQIKAENISYNSDGVSFSVASEKISLLLFGQFNVYNSLAAIAVAQTQGIDLLTAKTALEKVAVMPGRMELIENNRGFKVLVDYAPEPESLKQMFATIADHRLAENGRIIHVFGSCGGGRDTARRPVLGQISAAHSAVAIITNEDPYDDDPALIIDQVAQGAISGGLVLGQNLYKEADRRAAIVKAFSLAQVGDLVILTGKGSEQAICSARGEKIPWDDRRVAREELEKLS